MVLRELRAPLERTGGAEEPAPGPHELSLRVRACGVCRTDLHIVDGELPNAKLPRIPGHEVVGVVEELGPETSRFHRGDRVGVPWLAWTCAECEFCTSGRENLCDRAQFTGYDRDGGYAERAVADERYCHPVPSAYGDVEAAPLLCAGSVGYRALRAAGRAPRLGLYGFGASAHLIAQLARQQRREVYAFTRPGDSEGQEFARSLGAVWAGGSDERPPEPLDAAILFAPVGALVPAALRATKKGGTVVAAGIHMSDISSFPYELLWGERTVQSVANLTRADGAEFLEVVSKHPVRVRTTEFRLDQANEALARLREGRIEGAAVLVP